ncbi:amino acid/amide ABC transporter ATP-binding protein 2 (HAAT family) [Rhodovulum bhavnagarense]|uniref:Amino acid/amide ABC transporter ATP-binding protein 2 (HAAT family) n=1 Tax=Rhodovulum bhavnagarense TaxID=992286 RepID=A0A4R2RJ04_9RHOB|nr:ABC transporter ATP-binding protein [Rhodovulum bhavnagarense]TCP62834.1 amino acid/amide ABC transporter ATP-binding protein 2 (HAAT family) [Rhodovulum bhavnagarense]
MTLLTMEGITAFYGHSQALFGVDLTLAEGEVLALMGRNGMGKTTTIRTLTRLLPHRDGAIRFDGHALAGLPPHRAARLGLGLVPEGRRVFAPLSVEENLIAAARPGPWDMARVTALFPRLGERRAQRAGSLSGGEQQMLAIGRALMTNPRLLILDEATEGLAPLIRAEIWAAIHRLKDETGLSILVVDKSLKELAQVADRAVILEKGRTAWAGPMADVTQDLADRYLGV